MVLFPSGDMEMPQKEVKKEKEAGTNWREELEQITKGDKLLLKYKKFTIARLMERKTTRFTCYRKIDGKRATLKVVSDKDEQELADWITKQVNELKAKAKK
jgi:hypothetical protein